MAKTRPETILIKGDSWVTHEADAAVILTPGEFVTFDSVGDFALPTAGDTLKMIVIEDDIAAAIAGVPIEELSVSLGRVASGLQSSRLY